MHYFVLLSELFQDATVITVQMHENIVRNFFCMFSSIHLTHYGTLFFLSLRQATSHCCSQ